HDHPSHVLRAFVPPPALDAYLALRALNVETALIPDAASTPAVAALRYRFWQDAVSAALTPPHAAPKEPIATLLAHAAAAAASSPSAGSSSGSGSGSRGATSAYKAPVLSLPRLRRLLSARASRVEAPPPATPDALDAHAETTYASLLYLTLSAARVAHPHVDHVASHVGKAQGIVAALRGLPLLVEGAPRAQRGNTPQAAGLAPLGTSRTALPLPLSTLADCGVRDEDLYRYGPGAENVRDAVFAVATRAHDHLRAARELAQAIRAGREPGHAFEHEEDLAVEDAARYASAGGGLGGDMAEAERELERGFGILMQGVAVGLWLERLQRADFDVWDRRVRGREWKLPWRAFWGWRRREF
ncbi:Squalene/phytoene synthase, partial [Lineolata rhizophorae]